MLGVMKFAVAQKNLTRAPSRILPKCQPFASTQAATAKPPKYVNTGCEIAYYTETRLNNDQQSTFRGAKGI